MCLMYKHYFLDEDVNVTRWYIDNYLELKSKGLNNKES